MKVTRSQLKQLVKEELSLLNESNGFDRAQYQYDNEQEFSGEIDVDELAARAEAYIERAGEVVSYLAEEDADTVEGFLDNWQSDTPAEFVSWYLDNSDLDMQIQRLEMLDAEL